MAAGRSSGRAVEDALERSRRSARVRREPRAEPFDLRRRAGMPLGRRALEEAQRFLFVLRHAATGYIKHAEALGCFPPALRRGEAVPPRGFFERLRHAITVREQLAEAVLRNRKSLLGCAPVPHRGGLVVDLDARAVLVEYPQCVLGSCVSLRHGEFVQL
eukprot:CAMPEP_0184080998 /NCGR_PEP_ID=MMETSP0974-20121125/2483_1 /TAXON_ID=483370 /ORGANISM="non described non described, Strain CCMP2097" /LENGTH=159 /DNA_ID=CAMNT_0026383667 /DNA_START=83 /DNA_END=562 /DNA_ORIENTATION=-